MRKDTFGYAVHVERAAEIRWCRSRCRSEVRLVAVGGVTQGVDAATHGRRVHLLAKGLAVRSATSSVPEAPDRREGRGLSTGRGDWQGAPSPAFAARASGGALRCPDPEHPRALRHPGRGARHGPRRAVSRSSTGGRRVRERPRSGLTSTSGA